MRVLMQNWLSEPPSPGGDSIQLLSTKRALEELGVSVDYGPNPPRPLSSYDIIHLFNLITTDTYVNTKRVRKKGVPLVLSSIYWPTNEFFAKGISFTGNGTIDSIIRKLRPLRRPVSIAHSLMNGRFDDPTTEEILKKGEHRIRKEILDDCQCVLPNSIAEADVLHSEFAIPKEKMVVVPNSVSPIFFDSTIPPRVPHGLEGQDYVLSVARIEDRKNTLSLIEACISLEVPLVLVGRYNERNGYTRACLRVAQRGRVLVLGTLEPQSEALCGTYRGAAVHALVSWFETPGLSNLEAAASGCRIVSTDRGSAREYFGDAAIYADPSNLGSIERAIKTALSGGGAEKHRTNLRERIKSQFNWDVAAKRTLEGYERALEAMRRR
jgi:glycosyltransferase involved in cell wall biosynthesis